MKITIEDPKPGEEEEIIIRCQVVDDSLVKLIQSFKQGKVKMNLYKNGKMFLVLPEEIYYFESVDQKVFAYAKMAVYETKSKLYELEKELPPNDFIRASKSSILNINMIKSLTPAFNGKLEANLKNGEKIIISRQYVPELKEKLGLIQK